MLDKVYIPIQHCDQLRSILAFLASLVHIPMMQAPAFRNGKNDEARDAMIATFDALPRRAHGRKEIEKLLDKHRREWRLLAQTTSSDLIEYLQTLHLSVIDLTGEGHSQERVRYSWRDPTVFDVAQSLGKRAYISHQSAAFLHGIADNPGQPVFVNIEQSPKDKPDGELSQVGIDRAFKSKQRQSAFSYTFRTCRIIVLSGKNT